VIYAPKERDEQKAVFRWAAIMAVRWPELRLLYHVPNGGSRHRLEAANLRREGLKPGVPDICLPVARRGYHGLYIELKRSTGGRLTEHQKEWIDDLTEQGYRAVVLYGADAAVAEIGNYLSGGKRGRK
jgi:hypothetical protein